MLRHAWLLLIVLFAVALTTSGAVHAREAPDSTAIACGGEAHADGDRDQVPADGDQNMPHHHGGCHGHAVGLEAGSPAPFLHLNLAGLAVAPSAAALASLLIDPALRPPRG
ncbi:hypothetical protein ABIC65_001569 [Sphingomonas trueperi]|uniref:hypothetical protein n=1 Tax=Sphingomonas trueperi TaxID=53317 RepID=UPI00339880FD